MDGEFGFFDKDLFDNLRMPLVNSEGYFGRVELGLDRLEGVLYSSTAHWHSWEQHFGRLVMEFGKVEENFCKREMDFGNSEGGILVCGGSILVDGRRSIWITSLRIACLVRILGTSRTTLLG